MREPPSAPPAPLPLHVWETRYRYRTDAGPVDATIADTWLRVAGAVAGAERADRGLWRERFLGLLRDFRFLPGGRIQAGAGTERDVTLLNCFVMGVIEDSLEGIFQALQEGALTMQGGGGVGYDFSTIRPRGARARASNAIASGPVSFMHIWDAMCATVLSTGARRGAMMATLRCDHPDIEEFVEAKRSPGRLRHFNLSVQVSDAFMEAVRLDQEWPLLFPAASIGAEGEIVHREWTGRTGAVPCRVMRRLPVRRLWDLMMRACYGTGEPGVLFTDRINRMNNLWYCERITATNPCGEVPLPPYGACDLGSINLARLVRAPFSPDAAIDHAELAAIAATAVRFLDNVIDITRFPLPAQAETARRTRRIGLGITGLADALVMMGLRYDRGAACTLASDLMRTICHAAYRSAIALAEERGAFPAFERDNYLSGAFIRTLPDDIRDGVARHGIRNSHLLAIAPAGTISLLAGNISSGIEPVFAPSYQRTIRDERGHSREFAVTDAAVLLWRRLRGTESGLPEAFVSASDLPAAAHLDMLASLQPYVDNSIAKTINVPANCSFDDFRRLYEQAYDRGLKGVTAFRAGCPAGAVLTAGAGTGDAAFCCG